MAEENEDDVTIEDLDGILRRVPNWPDMFKLDKNMNAYRPTSACFTDKDGGKKLSVTLERPLLDGGGTHKDAIAIEPKFGLARIEAGFVRHNVVPAQKIQREPTGTDLYHALIIGEKDKRARKAMAKAAQLIITPEIT